MSEERLIRIEDAQTKLRDEIREVRTDLRNEMGALRVDLKGHTAAVRDSLRNELSGAVGDLIRRMDEKDQELRKEMGVMHGQVNLRFDRLEDKLDRALANAPRRSPPRRGR